MEKKYKILYSSIFVLFLILLVSAVDFTPQGNINLRNTYNMTNLNYFDGFSMAGDIDFKDTYNLTNLNSLDGFSMLGNIVGNTTTNITGMDYVIANDFKGDGSFGDVNMTGDLILSGDLIMDSAKDIILNIDNTGDTGIYADGDDFYAQRVGLWIFRFLDGLLEVDEDTQFNDDVEFHDDVQFLADINGSGEIITTTNMTADYFHGRFNWTTTDEWSSFDGATFNFNESQLETVYFLASALEVKTGSGAGNLADIQTYNRTYYNVTESNSDFELRVNFTGITEFTTLLVRHKTSVVAGHSATIQIWDYGDSDWEGYGFLSEQTTSAIQTLGVYDDEDHISGGVVQVRFVQDEGPPNLAHVHYFDWVGISKGFGTPVGTEVDPLSFHREMDLNNSGYNITADYYFGSGEKLGGVYLITNLFGFYNLTDFSIADYYLDNNPEGYVNASTETDPVSASFSYYNSTDFSIADYYLDNNPEGYVNSSTETDPVCSAFSYYNSTDFSIADYYLDNNPEGYVNVSTETDPICTAFGYYNSTDFSISDYYLDNNPESFYNVTSLVETDPISAAFSYYNSTDFSISDYYLDNNPEGFYNSTSSAIFVGLNVSHFGVVTTNLTCLDILCTWYSNATDSCMYWPSGGKDCGAP